MRSFGCPESAPHRRTSPLEPSLKDHIVTASVGLTRPEDDWVHWLLDNKARLSKLSNQPDPYMPLYQELLLYLYDLQIVTHTEFSNSVFRRLFLFHAQEFSVSLFGHVSYVRMSHRGSLDNSATARLSPTSFPPMKMGRRFLSLLFSSAFHYA